MIQWFVDQAVAVRIQGMVIGLVTIENIIISSNYSIIWRRMSETIHSVKKHFTMESLYKDTRIQGMRNIYKSLGIDPSRYRPASERLIRRILKSKEISRIHPVVDICNLISIQHCVPLGLYDMQKIEGKIYLRFGKSGESYLGLTDLQISASEKFIVADDKGPIGSPTTDSVRTKIDNQTNSVLMIAYGPIARQVSLIEDTLNDFATLVQEFTGGRETWREIRIVGKE